MSGIDATLAERGSRYGSFAVQATIEQALMTRLADTPRWNALAPDQKSAIQMICVKLARIVNGDPNYADNWHDIIGYARLVDDRLASADTRRDGEDATKIAAEFTSGAVPHEDEADAQTPSSRERK